MKAISTKDIIAMTPDKFSKKGKRMAAIINAMNKYFANVVLQNRNVRLPHKFGYLTLSRYDNFVKGDKVTYFVDWNATKKLWEEDSYCRINKTLVRHVVKSNLRMLLKDSTYKHNNFYTFKPCKTVKRKLGLLCQDEEFTNSVAVIMSDDSLTGRMINRINKRNKIKQNKDE
jgi:hypothetical protein